ncbi:hypothetical protein OIU79_025910 [Salix purpurea]|uniref:Uncharacterized protein n=1 Tax=Salix purpurea TaxID=77065 RepID=A0A9Q1A7V6_SALPP|nr:hypothetical protein OIU79_025910 [Salix purpurea]
MENSFNLLYNPVKIIQWIKKVVERQTWVDDLSREDQEALLETNPHGDLPCQCRKKEMSGLEDEVALKDEEIHYLNKLLSSKDQGSRRLIYMKTPQQYQQRRLWYAERDIIGAHSSYAEYRTL